MRKHRILVVDDSALVRRSLAQLLGEDPGLEVAGTAPDGRLALAKIPQCVPDLVVLDMEMPNLDGLATLQAIRKEHPTLPVIMFSSLTDRGARVTLDALALGADDYVTKPTGAADPAEARARIRSVLLPKIHALCGRHSAGAFGRPAATSTHPSQQLPAAGGNRSAQVVAIGVSTGGPNALAALLSGLPSTFPAPVLIVQHMPRLFTTLLAERLDACSSLSVREATQGEPVLPGRAYVCPGDYHMRLNRDRDGTWIALDQGPLENSCRPAADVLFRSVAEAFGNRALAVVLTGMGQDGLRGCEHVADAGGSVIVQDEATSVVWGMPGAVARSGLADVVAPLPAIAGLLQSCAAAPL